MKWFRHDTDSSRDERLALLEASCGLEGYGFYWAVLEVIAEKASAPGEASASFPVKVWCGLLCTSPQGFKRLLAACSNIGLFRSRFKEVCGKKVVEIASEVPDGEHERDDAADEIYKDLFGGDDALSFPLALERSAFNG
ncbi:MAG TPA: DUF4373 domain-containing protein [Thermosynergistes sp.]|nr:DUF4373 domain-containing protein [Thermosynergistes sp.]HXK90403.1 DUF4373 domain-containing protein [Thermosynergistes sp.]